MILFFRSLTRSLLNNQNKNNLATTLNIYKAKFSLFSVVKSAAVVRENINIGTIGHIDHGKTTLTSAITKVLSDKKLARYVPYDKIDSAPEEKRRGITINLMHVGYSTSKRNYAHVDCPGHADFIKNMITGTSQMDAAILVIAASEGVMPQTKEHLALAKAIGVQNIVVYLNKADLADKEMIELVDIEVKDLLASFGYDPDNIPVVCGSALHALNGTNDEIGKQSILKLLDIIDSQVPSPKRDTKSPFQLPIEKSVAVPGRGQVIVGTITKGTLKKGDPIELVGYDEVIKTAASEIHIFKNSVNECFAGDHVGVLLRGIKPGVVRRGMVAAQPNSTQQTNNVEASIYVLKKEEGGRKNPITSGYIQPIFINLATIDCLFNLPQDKNILMGGDNTNLSITFLYPLVVNVGDKFTVRESLTLTSCTGVVTKLLAKTKKDIRNLDKTSTPKQAPKGKK